MDRPHGAFFIAKHPVTFEATGSELRRAGKGVGVFLYVVVCDLLW